MTTGNQPDRGATPSSGMKVLFRFASLSVGGAGHSGGNDAMSALLARNWWAILLRGLIAVLLGIISFAAPVATMLSLALLFGAYLLIDGVLGIIATVRAARAHERWGMLLAEGVLNILMGVVALAFPGGAVLAFVLVTAAWALLTGGLMVGATFRLNKEHGRWWLALSGIASIIWGVLLVIAPIIGAIVMTWWLGVYALVFGLLLLILAFKLRGERNRVAGSEAPPYGTA